MRRKKEKRKKIQKLEQRHPRAKKKDAQQSSVVRNERKEEEQTWLWFLSWPCVPFLFQHDNQRGLSFYATAHLTITPPSLLQLSIFPFYLRPSLCTTSGIGVSFTASLMTRFPEWEQTSTDPKVSSLPPRSWSAARSGQSPPSSVWWARPGRHCGSCRPAWRYRTSPSPWWTSDKSSPPGASFHHKRSLQQSKRTKVLKGQDKLTAPRQTWIIIIICMSLKPQEGHHSPKEPVEL